MVLDGLRGYLQLANGLTDVTRERAMLAAKGLLAQGEASVGAVLPDSLKTQVSSLTEDLIATSKANRALLVGLVGSEVERATARLGLAMSGELDAAKRRAQRLEQRVADLERVVREGSSGSAPGAVAGSPSSGTAAPAPKKAAKKSPARAKKTTAKKAPAKKAHAATTPAATTPAAPTSAASTSAETTT
jgi:polyhydroxyalkanoate synthesis regulator phasin